MTALGEYVAESPATPLTSQHNSKHASSSHRLGPRIDPCNVGYQLLQKAGWAEGQGLGSNQQGRPIPLGAYHQQARQGIGGSSKPSERQQRGQVAAGKKRHERVTADEDKRLPQQLPVPDVPEDPHVKRQRHQQVCIRSLGQSLLCMLCWPAMSMSCHALC